MPFLDLRGRLALMTLVVLSGLSLLVVRAEGACKAGHAAFVTDSCSILWTPPTGNSTDDFLPWASPNDAKSALAVPVTGVQCAGVKVLDVRPADGMAKIECLSSGRVGWMNLLSLTCSDETRKRAALPSCRLPKNGPMRMDFTQGASAVTNRQAQQALKQAFSMAVDVQTQANSDKDKLTFFYTNLGDAEIERRLLAGMDRLQVLKDRALAAYGEDCNRPGDTQGQRTCLLLKNSVALGRDYLTANIGASPSAALTAYLKKTKGVTFQHGQFLSLPAPGGGSRSMAALSGMSPREFVGSFRISRTDGITYDDLNLRMLLYYGLLPEEQDKIRRQLAFVRKSVEIPGIQFLEFHNGYVFGGRRLGTNAGGAYDCSDFISQVLSKVVGSITPAGRSKKSPAFSTLYFKSLALSLKTGRTPPKPWGSCFRRVNIAAGEEPLPGDIAVSTNTAVKQSGHMVLVTGYDREHGEIATIEAAGGTRNTVWQFRRPLYEPSACAGPGYGHHGQPRPDVEVLRFVDAPDCPLREI